MLRKFLLIAVFYAAVSAHAQNVGINSTGTAPDASAMLDVNSTNKGVLIPRIALTALNAASPVTTPANSLLVYNTATAGTTPNNVTPGFYYWSTDSTKWIKIVGATGNDLSKDVWLDVDSNKTVQTAYKVEDGSLRGDSAKMVVTDIGRVGIGTANPLAALHVVSSASIFFDRLGNGDIFTIRKARTGSTFNNILGINNYGIGLGQFVLTGHDGTNWDATAGSCIQAVSAQPWTASQKGTFVRFFTTPKDSARRAIALVLNNIGQAAVADTFDTAVQEPEYMKTYPSTTSNYRNARFNISIFKSATEKALYIKSVNSEAVYIDAPLADEATLGADKYLVWNSTTKKVGAYLPGVLSDVRFKDHVEESKYGLDNLMKIDVKDFEYTSKPGEVLNGFMAQNLYEAYPDAVYVGSDEKDATGKLVKPWRVDYGRVTPLLVKSLQEQQQEIDTLKKQMQTMQEQLELLMNEVKQLKK